MSLPKVHVPIHGHLQCRHQLSVVARESANEVCAHCQRIVNEMTAIIIEVANANTEDAQREARLRARGFGLMYFPEEV